MKGGRGGAALWHPGAGDVASDGPVLAALAAALDLSPTERHRLVVERRRLAGRSSIYIISSPVPLNGLRRWLVKQPHPDFVQEDLVSPLDAAAEYQAMSVLHAHFAAGDSRIRVPAPVAHLAEIEALAMEFVPGRPLRQLLTYGSVREPTVLLRGVRDAGTFARRVHELEPGPPSTLDLGVEAREVAARAEEELVPLGLRLPQRVRSVLDRVPPRVVPVRQVRLHGDIQPTNILLADDGSTVGIDAALDRVGDPEQDVVRFIALMSGSIRFAPDVVGAPANWVRHRLEREFLSGYYGTPQTPPLFELRLLRLLTLRWRRARVLAQQNEHPRILRARLALINAQMSSLMRESASRLSHGLESS